MGLVICSWLISVLQHLTLHESFSIVQHQGQRGSAPPRTALVTSIHTQMRRCGVVLVVLWSVCTVASETESIRVHVAMCIVQAEEDTRIPVLSLYLVRMLDIVLGLQACDVMLGFFFF